MCLTLNIAARNALTRLLTQPTQGVSADQAEDVLFGWLYKHPGMPTLDDCKRLAQQMYDERGIEDTEALLQRFGIKSVKDLWIGLAADFYNYAKRCLDEGLSPRDAMKE